MFYNFTETQRIFRVEKLDTNSKRIISIGENSELKNWAKIYLTIGKQNSKRITRTFRINWFSKWLNWKGKINELIEI